MRKIADLLIFAITLATITCGVIFFLRVIFLFRGAVDVLP